MIVVNGHLPLVLFDIEVSFKWNFWLLVLVVVNMRLPRNYWSLRTLSKFSWLLVMTGWHWTVLIWSISEFPNILSWLTSQKRTILLGPLLVQTMPLRLGSWMISIRQDSKPLVRLRLRLSWSGLRILLRKSWSNMMFQQQPMAHFQILRKPRPISKKKALQSLLRQMVWRLERVLS